MMAQIIRDIVLPLDEPACVAVIAKEGDQWTRFLRASLTENQRPANIENYLVATARFRKKDRVVLTTAEISEGTVMIEIPREVLAFWGNAVCDLAFYDGEGGILSTASFALDVLKSPDLSEVYDENTAMAALMEALEELADIKGYSDKIDQLDEDAENERQEWCRLSDPVTVEDLQGKNTNDIYNLMDAYVERGVVSKHLVGYATKPSPAADPEHPDNAEQDLNSPIFLYRYRKISAPVDHKTDASVILISACIHGNEKTGIPPILNLLKLIESGENPFVNRVTARFGIDILPVVNPFGADVVSAAVHDPDFYNGEPLTVQLMNEIGEMIDEAKADPDYMGNRGQSIGAYCTENIDRFPDEQPIADYYDDLGVDADLSFSINGITNRIEFYNALVKGPGLIDTYFPSSPPTVAQLQTRRENIRALRTPYLMVLNRINRDYRFVGRTNGRWVNLNRNADYCWQSWTADEGSVDYKGPGPASELETQVLETLAADMKYVMYLETHGLRERLMAQVLSDGGTFRQIARTTIEKLAKRVPDFGLDFDEYHQGPDGEYGSGIKELDHVPYPLNRFIHDRPSAERGAIVELQRADDMDFYPTAAQIYTSEFFLTYLAETAEFLEKNIVSGQVSHLKALGGVDNVLPMDNRSWGNIVHGGDDEGTQGQYRRLSTNDGITVKNGVQYTFGVSSTNNNVYMKLWFVPTGGSGALYGDWARATRRWTAPGNGVVYPYLAKGANLDQYIDAMEIGKTIIPFLAPEAAAVSS